MLRLTRQEFVTGSQGATLGDVVVSLGFDAGTYAPHGELAADNGGTVGADLTALTSPRHIPAAFQLVSPNVTLTPATDVTLAANTGYWVILSAGAGSDRLRLGRYGNNEFIFPEFWAKLKWRVILHLQSNVRTAAT